MKPVNVCPRIKGILNSIRIFFAVKFFVPTETLRGTNALCRGASGRRPQPPSFSEGNKAPLKSQVFKILSTMDTQTKRPKLPQSYSVSVFCQIDRRRVSVFRRIAGPRVPAHPHCDRRAARLCSPLSAGLHRTAGVVALRGSRTRSGGEESAPV